MGTKTDPVCKMEVDPQDARAKTQHKGETYYFCSPECKKEFDKKPKRYAGEQAKKQ
jgi:YHS domain-containing protein